MAELAAARAEVAAAAELEALRASSTCSSVSVDDDRDNELKPVREAAREQGRRCGSPDGRGRVGGALGKGARVSRAPDGGSSQVRSRRWLG
jgi:hypothetical protein